MWLLFKIRQELYKHPDTLDVNCLYTNDVHVMANQYGIETAYQVIISVHVRKKMCIEYFIFTR